MKEGKMEKKNIRILIIAGIVGAVLLLVAVFLVTRAFLLYNKVTDNKLEMGISNNGIHVTPEQITSLQEIGQWEFLSIADEEMVDTVRDGLFIDDKLVRIYYGTLRLGIDMSRMSHDRIYSRGDTLCVQLPAITLLDDNFIDEARTRSFISEGSWSGADREELYQRAKNKMLRQCMTPKNISRAEDNAKAQIRVILRSMGFENTDIKIDG
jgi:hypothetical protein